MAKKSKVKYYLTGSSGQTIKMEAHKHPILWRFLAKNWDKICEEYEEAKKEHGFYSSIFSGHVPHYNFDEENWRMIEKETGLKGTQIRLGIDSPNAALLYLKFDFLHGKTIPPII